MKNFLRRLVDFLSRLERPQRKEGETESHSATTCRSTLIRQSVHFLGVSATHFQQGVQFFCLAVCFAANSIKISAKILTLGIHKRLCGTRQSAGRTSRYSCPKSNPKNEGVSND